MTKESFTYGKHSIPFTLQYASRKTIGVKVQPDTSVHVTAPVALNLDTIKENLLKKARWICKQKSYFLNIDGTPLDYEIKSGYSILYLGRQYKIVVEKAEKDGVSYKGNLFLISVKNKDRTKQVFQEWLKHRSKQIIAEIAKPIIKKFSEQFSVPEHIYFQDMPTRWGSCTIKNKLIFNPKLIHTPKRCIEYVVMHELCHTVHKHHNRTFFELLTSLMPDWEKRKMKLDLFV